ncbi:MAG TPA: hypothetical protein VJA16_12435, partial [Thermoanaerobaculia bacterium]
MRAAKDGSGRGGIAGGATAFLPRAVSGRVSSNAGSGGGGAAGAAGETLAAADCETPAGDKAA